MNVTREFSGKGYCPYDPRHNSTSIFADGELYSGTVSDFSGTDALVIKNQIRTEQYNYKHLNGPDFVNSVEDEDFVYFFFREEAVEAMNCGKSVYSRVARGCKNDRGLCLLLLQRGGRGGDELWEECVQPCGARMQERSRWSSHVPQQVDDFPQDQAQLLRPWQLPLLLRRSPVHEQHRCHQGGRHGLWNLQHARQLNSWQCRLQLQDERNSGKLRGSFQSSESRERQLATTRRSGSSETSSRQVSQ